MKTNQLFCYWLQGYFEIGLSAPLHKSAVLLIAKQLDAIEQPLGPFTSWLREVCDYIESLNYSDLICAHFSPVIELSLNSVFHHVIDNSYITDIPREELHRIHEGISS